MQVNSLTSGVTDIAAGTSFSCAVVNGGASGWGFNTDGELGNNSRLFLGPDPVQAVGLTANVSSISAAATHACAIANGLAYCWASNDHGQLGTGSMAADSLVPVQVTLP